MASTSSAMANNLKTYSPDAAGNKQAAALMALTDYFLGGFDHRSPDHPITKPPV